ncbi:MAG: cytochrome b/b6 domain-containing protein [Cardiobacteriaceae bacterium]|nr:cytochrome b/b6 domain-containing protein [Cardiobacteriaceae bacterium]
MKEKFTWDRLVRSSHWVVAFCVLANLFWLRPASTPHQALGYLAVALVLVRLTWSVLGASEPARFRDLIPTPKGLLRHIQELKHREHRQNGHNHFGLLAIWLMWFCIAGLAFTGYHAANETELLDKLYDKGYELDEIHGQIAWVLQAIVGLHVVAVILSSWWLKHDLVRPMIIKPRSR